jgi:exoribonuclease II
MNQLTTFELSELAREALIENGFQTEFPTEIIEKVNSINEEEILYTSDSSIRDLRSLLWSSIDNRTSRDLDQIEYAETLPNGDIRLLIGIADVDSFVPQNSSIDKFAARNTVSIYAGETVFSMLPERLSTDLTSLREGVDRLAVVTEMIISDDGAIKSTDIYHAIVHNYVKLNYEEIGEWLEEDENGGGILPEKLLQVKNLESQIRLQKEAAARLYDLRKQNGALELESIESSPVIMDKNIVDIASVQTNAARRIIENFMIAANVQMAEFLENKNLLSLRRVVKIPERWKQITEFAASFSEKLPDTPDSKALANFLERQKAADPLAFPDLSLSIIKLLGSSEYVVQKPNEEIGGHFGLAVRDYTHSTAPNRRYADLIVQRLVKAALENNRSPYTPEELDAVARRCNERESRAKKIERRLRKSMAASVMQSRVGENFTAIVTGLTARGTFARILRPPVDGRIVKGEENLQVGEKARVRLLAVNPRTGFIDFARVV